MKKVPIYGNNFFFTIGVYLLELIGILVISGMLLVLMGPEWGNTIGFGNFVLSLHLWAAEAFLTLIFLHLFVNFSTSAYKNKKLVWSIGSLMLFVVLLEFAFGVAIPGDFVSQVNARAGADLWNGMGLGFWINPLNYGAVIGWHIAIVPILLIALAGIHYLLVKRKGLSKPYRKDIPYKIVDANHKIMYKRMAYIFVILILFAFLFHAPYSTPITLQSMAIKSPSIFAITLLQEFAHNSTTATYLDTIDPYTFNTRTVYVSIPYNIYVNATNIKNELTGFYSSNTSIQNQTITDAFAYFEQNGSINGAVNSSNPLISTMGTLTKSAQAGIYGPVLQSETVSGINQTYTLLFISDSTFFENQTTANGMQISQWGMLPIGNEWWQRYMMYWVAPYNILEIATANISWWGDLQNGSIALVTFLILILFPYIPYLEDIPDKLKLYKLFWNRYTIPQMKKRKTKNTK